MTDFPSSTRLRISAIVKPVGNSKCGSSTKLVQSPPHFRPSLFPITETEIATRTLADILGEKDESLHILKLDVQGAELEILDGMGYDRRNDLVMVEAEINMAGGGCLGAPTFRDIEEMLTTTGMRLYGMNAENNYRKKRGNKFWYHKNLFPRFLR